MGLFSVNTENTASIDEILEDPTLLEECFIYDELSHMDDESRKAFIESEECAMLEAKGLVNRKTLVRLSKSDDLTRRKTMAAYQLAKEANDPLWNKLVLNRVKERELIEKIVQKYGNKANRAATIGQKEYMKNRHGLLKKFDLSKDRETLKDRSKED